jgi:hypothetical protein
MRIFGLKICHLATMDLNAVLMTFYLITQYIIWQSVVSNRLT